MGFKEDIKADPANKNTVLIVEDSEKKLKYFLESLQEGKQEQKTGPKIEYHISGDLEDAWDFFLNNSEKISVVILDCAVPREPGKDAAYYAGLEIMPKIIRRDSNVSIIFNTPARLPYDAMPQNNVIYISQNRTVMSDLMEGKCKNDAVLNYVLELLRNNNRQLFTKTMQTYQVVPTQQKNTDRLH